MGNVHPFIPENGGAAVFPFAGQYETIQFGRSYTNLTATLHQLAKRSQIGVRGFADMTAIEVATITGEIFEVARAKIVDHRQPRLRKFFLQRKGEIRANEAGASGDN